MIRRVNHYESTLNLFGELTMNHQVETYDVEAPTPLDILVGMVSKTVEETTQAWVQTMTLRVPMHEACVIDALATHSGQSRNKIAIQIIKTGLYALWQDLPTAERADLQTAASQLLRERLKDQTTESGEV